jgi:hypothetical protein
VDARVRSGERIRRISRRTAVGGRLRKLSSGDRRNTVIGSRGARPVLLTRFLAAIQYYHIVANCKAFGGNPYLSSSGLWRYELVYIYSSGRTLALRINRAIVRERERPEDSANFSSFSRSLSSRLTFRRFFLLLTAGGR